MSPESPISKSILVVIPARGGSKGIPKKNLQQIHGRSLTEWAVLSAGKIPFNKKVIVSSDDDEILSITRDFDFAEPSQRPEALSGDSIADYEVLRHELFQAEKKYSTEFACIVMLQPTSPIRRPETISACVNSILDCHSTAIWTVSKVPVKFHPRKQLLVKEGKLTKAVDSPLVIKRQDLEDTFIRTGVCYALHRSTLLDDENLLGINPLPYFCPWPYTNIDEWEDLRIAEELTVDFEGSLRPRRID